MPRVFVSQNGDKCDSDFERVLINDLIERGIRYEYESPHATFEYIVPLQARFGHCFDCGGNLVGQKRKRKLDLWLPDHGFVVEIKGKFPPTIRTKMTHLIEQNRDADIRFFFMRNGWQNNRTKKRTYMDWARVRGIKAAVGDPRENPGTKAYGCGALPEEWFE
jgi:hypothetical protein